MRPFGPMLRGARGTLAAQGITFAQLLFQLFVTILGVYIAIVLQDGADQRSRARAADRTLQAIEAELAADEANLGAIIEAQRAQADQMIRLAGAVRDPGIPDTTLYRIFITESISNRTFFFRSAGYAALVATGQLEFVQDQNLRLALTQIYEHDYDRLRVNGDLSDAIFQELFRRAQLGFWDYEMDRRISRDPQPAIEMSNAAHRVSRFTRYYIGVLEDTRVRVGAARALVAEYLEQR